MKRVRIYREMTCVVASTAWVDMEDDMYERCMPPFPEGSWQHHELISEAFFAAPYVEDETVEVVDSTDFAIDAYHDEDGNAVYYNKDAFGNVQYPEAEPVPEPTFEVTD